MKPAKQENYQITMKLDFLLSLIKRDLKEMSEKQQDMQKMLEWEGKVQKLVQQASQQAQTHCEEIKETENPQLKRNIDSDLDYINKLHDLKLFLREDRDSSQPLHLAQFLQKIYFVGNSQNRMALESQHNQESLQIKEKMMLFKKQVENLKQIRKCFKLITEECKLILENNK